MAAEIEQQAWAEEAPVSEEFPELFHYTSIAALEGILESNTLRASRATCLNDQSELELFWPRITPVMVDYCEKTLRKLTRRNPELKGVVSSLGGISHVAASEGSTVVQTLRAQILGNDAEPTVAPIFVTCFTTHSGESETAEYHRQNGMLSQWRGYCGSQGVAIVFNTRGIEDLLRAEYEQFHLWPYSISDVVYDSKHLDVEERFPALFNALGAFVQAVIGILEVEASRALPV